ncbi:hypothetical protein B1690_00770 [Geobacillus sp. 46C-IIa]|nr:hypothetical protein B1690_00770 [Geobacillus sp. 46C-IIa]
MFLQRGNIPRFESVVQGVKHHLGCLPMNVLRNKGELGTLVHENPFCTQDLRGFRRREIQ